MMNYRKLGKSTLTISEIGFGCMSLTKNNADNNKLLHRAMELGINFFDTADLYQQGQNEIAVGAAIKDKRKDLIIATKVGNQWRADGSGWDWNPGKEYILSSIDKSLQRLQTDYIDLYQLHGGTMEDPIDETIEAFEILQQQGKIRYYGISSIRPNVIREYIERSNIVSVMMQYSLLDRRPEESCLDLLKNNNIGVLARGVLAKGLLVNKAPASYLNYSAAEVQQVATAIGELSGKHRNNSQTAIRFVLQNSAIIATVVGIRTIEQLEEVTQSTNIAPIEKKEMEILGQVLPINFYDQHR
jgi:aryl-alcohol dehydrogenase-like predicted oxidoreductase